MLKKRRKLSLEPVLPSPEANLSEVEYGLPKPETEKIRSHPEGDLYDKLNDEPKLEDPEEEHIRHIDRRL